MIPYKTLGVIGGDLRQAHIANCLAKQGKKVKAFLLEKNAILNPELTCKEPVETGLKDCEAVILPMPLSGDGTWVNSPFSQERASVSQCLRAMQSGTAVFAGKVDPKTQQLAEDQGVLLTDYLEREELAIHNARITAEGTLEIAFQELAVAIFKLPCLILGHGRVAKALIQVFNGVGAELSVAARKYSDLAQIQLEGCKPVPFHQLEKALPDTKLLINTVPSQILGKEQLALLPRDTLLIDLASRPGGICMEEAAAQGLKAIWALSLPGKCAPISAGEIILQTIENCVAEQEAL